MRSRRGAPQFPSSTYLPLLDLVVQALRLLLEISLSLLSGLNILLKLLLELATGLSELRKLLLQLLVLHLVPGKRILGACALGRRG